MAFDDELKFENAIVNLLTSQCGWENEIIRYPTEEDLIKNWANILFENNKEQDLLNNCPLTDSEMHQIITQINTLKTPVALNKFINGKSVSITRDNPDDFLHFGKQVSLKIYDRKEIAGGKSKYQIVEQPKFKTNNAIFPSRRGDILLLINGMPLYHIELKKSDIPISQATTQIEKYMKNNIFTGIFSLVQIFVAMNPEEAVYFANPGKNGKFNREYFFHWENFNNEIVNDWQTFTKDVLSIPMAHELIGFYTIADSTDGVLKVLRSYQYEAASRISDKVTKSGWTKSEQKGGYIWHTTGSGKTMTSFKAAQLIADSGDADKIVFLLDRVELGNQSLINYRNFADELTEIQNTEDTTDLINRLKSDLSSDSLIVTSIQKMSRVKDDANLKQQILNKIRSKKIVFIVDECHRSQMGKMHQDIKDLLPNAMYFGFTGTPEIKDDGDIPEEKIYTSDIFGDEIHRYTLYHGIRDKNVLGFDPYIINIYDEKNLREIIALEKCHVSTVEEALLNEKTKEVFLYYMNKSSKKCSMTEIEEMLPKVQYETDSYRNAVVNEILGNWMIRSVDSKFHAILATSSIPEAIKYYNIFKSKNTDLNITAIFDSSDDNSDDIIEKINGITEILEDYNQNFQKNYNINQYLNFKKDVCLRLAHKEPYLNINSNTKNQLDIVIVVDQLLTGFDSKWINTVYFDKELYGKNLIQAISRTNRLYGFDKPHGTVIFYRRPYKMLDNLHYAIKKYAGQEPFGLYVDKLSKNLEKMNIKYQEIKDLFEEVQIKNFEKNYNDIIWKRKFAKTFIEFNKYLDSAKIQGFRWSNLIYNKIAVELDEKIYLILVQRYKELFSKVKNTLEDIPYDIDIHITEIQTDSIDNDYMNSKFKIYLKALNNGDEEAKEIALNELHKTFATLTEVEQKYAKIFLREVEAGNLVINEEKTFRDYLTELHVNSNNNYIHNLSVSLGIDEKQFISLMNLGLTLQNINEYGRYDDLIKTLDIQKAKKYLDNRDNKDYLLREIRLIVDKELRQIILNGGVDDIVNNSILEKNDE